MTGVDYAAEVRQYLRYCRKAAAELKLQGSALDPKYHPTADGACRLIAHKGDTGEARKIREAFREAQSDSLPAKSAA